MSAPKTPEELYALFGPLVLRRARAMLGDEQLARDAAQDVFLNVVRSLHEFRQESSPVTWLYRATTNHCLNVLRARHRRGEVSDDVTERAAPDGITIDEKIALSAVLSRVPDALREIAVYYYLDQMSHEEIASMCGVSRRTVGNRLVEFHAAARVVAAERKVAL